MVQNNSLDTIEGYPHGQKETETFVSIIKPWDLQDTWGTTNGNNKDFNWSTKNPFIARGLHLLRLHLRPQCCKNFLKSNGG